MFKHFIKTMRSERGFTFTAAAIIIGAVAAAAGAGVSAYSSSAQGTAEHKAKEHQAELDRLARDASKNAALEAQQAQDARRRAAIASGGETLLTGQGGAQPGSSNTELKTLLGA